MFSDSGSVLEPGVHCLGKAGWPVNPRDLPVSVFPEPGLQACTTAFRLFDMGSRVKLRSSCMCDKSILTELPPTSLLHSSSPTSKPASPVCCPLWPQAHGLKQPSLLSLLSRSDYRHTLPCSAVSSLCAPPCLLLASKPHILGSSFNFFISGCRTDTLSCLKTELRPSSCPVPLAKCLTLVNDSPGSTVHTGLRPKHSLLPWLYFL